MSVRELFYDNDYDLHCSNMTVTGTLSMPGALSFTDLDLSGTTDSVSSSSGTLTVKGGAGIEKSVYIGGNLNVAGTITGSGGGSSFDPSAVLHLTNTSVSTDSTSGALTVVGGVGMKSVLNVGGATKIWNSTASTNTTSGALTVIGGVGMSSSLNVGGVTKIWNTTVSNDTSTGSLVVSGGIGVSGDIRCGGTFYGSISGGGITLGTDDATSTNTGGLIVPGGVGIGKNLFVGSNNYFGKALSQPEVYGAVGNGSTDDTTAINALVVANGYNKIYGDKKLYKTTNITDTFGIDFDDNMTIMNNSIPYNTYARRYLFWGKECLSPFYNKVRNNTAVKIGWCCDSIGLGYGTSYASSMIHNVVSNMAFANGFTNFTVYNGSVNGQSAYQWDNTPGTAVTADVAANCDIYLVRLGINDGYQSRTIEQYVANMRSGLGKIRAAHSVASGTCILVMSPTGAFINSSSDEVWCEKCVRALRRVAREYTCGFLDTYALIQNVRDGYTGGWMLNDMVHITDYVTRIVGEEVYKMIYPGVYQKALSNTVTITNPDGCQLYISGATLSADYSASGKQYYKKTGQNTVSVVAGEISVGVGSGIDFFTDSQCDGGQTGCIEFCYTPNFGATMTDWQQIIMLCRQSMSKTPTTSTDDNVNRLQLFLTDAHALCLYAYDYAGVVKINASSFGFWTPTIGQKYTISLNWNFTAGETRLFIDGTQLGSTNGTTFTRTYGSVLEFGYGASALAPPYEAKFSHVRLYNTVKRTTGYSVLDTAKTTIITNNDITVGGGTTTLTSAWSGPISTTKTITFKRIGGICSAYTYGSPIEASASNIITVAGNIPTGFFPGQNLYLPINIISDTNKFGTLFISSEGAIQIWAGATSSDSFTSGEDITPTFNVTYQL